MGEPLMILPPQSDKSLAIAKAMKFDKGLYAAKPGTGPANETCGSCKHIYRKHMAKTYIKCALVARFWTGGGGTDVKARAPACQKWESR